MKEPLNESKSDRDKQQPRPRSGDKDPSHETEHSDTVARSRAIVRLLSILAEAVVSDLSNRNSKDK